MSTHVVPKPISGVDHHRDPHREHDEARRREQLLAGERRLAGDRRDLLRAPCSLGPHREHREEEPPPTQKTATLTWISLKTANQFELAPSLFSAKTSPTATSATATIRGDPARRAASGVAASAMWSRFHDAGVNAIARTATRPAPPRSARRGRAARPARRPTRRGRRRSTSTRNALRRETSRIPLCSKATPKPCVASAFQSERSGKSRSSACIHATCVYGESREIANGSTPASCSSALLSRRSSSSLVQVVDQSKR